jgi:hypothetical protein
VRTDRLFGEPRFSLRIPTLLSAIRHSDGGLNLLIMHFDRYMLTAARSNPPAQLPAPFGTIVNQMKVAEWLQWLEPDLGTLQRHPEVMKKACAGYGIEGDATE